MSNDEARKRLADARFRAMIEHAAIGIAQVAPDGSWLYVNERLCQILGHPAEELLSKTFQNITHPDDLNADLAQVQRMLSGEIDDYTLEKRYLRKDGSAVWAKLTVSCARAGAEIDHFISVIEDISEQKRAGEELRESEERFRMLADNISQLAWIADASGWVNWYNQRWYDFTGTAFEEMAGWGWRKVHHPAHVERVVTKYSQALSCGEVWEDTFPLRGKDGQYRWFLSRALPIRNQAGEIIRWFGTNTDVTERREAQRTAQRLAAIVESSQDAIIGKDLNGVITSWNRGAERLLGHRAEEVIGKSVTTVIPVERLDEELEILVRIRRGEQVRDYETVRKRKDGSLVEMSLSVSPVKDANGSVAGASTIARDITERRLAEERQTLLLQEMSHRVKNLFTVASAIAVLSAREAATAQEMAQTMQNRLAALGRAHELTLTKPAADEPARLQGTTLHALVRTILQPFESAAKSGNERVTVTGADLSVGASFVTAFALLLHEFATNAAKYGALSVPTGRIDVEMREHEGTFLLIWKERDAPLNPAGVKEEGFGGTLVRATLQQFDGEITRDWTPEGLTICLRFQSSRVSE